MNTSTADTSRVLKSKPSLLKVFFKALFSVIKEIGPSSEFLETLFCFVIPVVSFVIWAFHLMASFMIFAGIACEGYVKEMNNFPFFTTLNLNFHLSVYGFIAFLLIKFAFKVKDRMKYFEED